MSTNENQNNEFLETLKSNYKRRIDEVDNFSKNFSISSADFRTQCLMGLSDMLQHYIDLQKKIVSGYPVWYDQDMMSRQSRMITEAWTNTIRNMNLLYSLSTDYWTKNMRLFHQGMMQSIQMTEMFNDMSEKIPVVQKNELLDKIKQAKEYNDEVMQKQIQKKNSSPSKDV